MIVRENASGSGSRRRLVATWTSSLGGRPFGRPSSLVAGRRGCIRLGMAENISADRQDQIKG